MLLTEWWLSLRGRSVDCERSQQQRVWIRMRGWRMERMMRVMAVMACSPLRGLFLRKPAQRLLGRTFSVRAGDSVSLGFRKSFARRQCRQTFACTMGA